MANTTDHKLLFETPHNATSVQLSLKKKKKAVNVPQIDSVTSSSV